MVPITIADFASQGITLIPATAEDFDTRANSILSDRAGPVLELKPFLAIVRSENPRTVVAYTVSWTAVRKNDSSETRYTQFKFPDAVAGTSNGLAILQRREIKPGEERLVGMGFEAWPMEYVDTFRDFGAQEKDRLTDIKSLHIALDAVIFHDGMMLGPDQSALAEHFIAYVQAKQILYRDVVIGLENGSVVDDVFAPLRASVLEPRTRSSADQLGIYPREAAAEVLGLHHKMILEVFRRALRRDPFTIRRE